MEILNLISAGIVFLGLWASAKALNRIADSILAVRDSINGLKLGNVTQSVGRVSEAKSREERKVAELPPEVIAPSIKKPPRPKGGFGRKN